MEIFEYQFIINAIVCALLVGIASGIAGTYMVVRRMVFLGGGITHSSFGGIGLAYYLGLNPLWGALAFGLFSAFAIERISSKGNIREDSAIGILWSVGMALGVIFVVLTPGYAPNLMSFLFGNILMVESLDLALLAVLDVGLIAAMVLGYRQIIYTAFDREFARCRGIAVQRISYLMMMAMALTIVFAIKSVGIMLLLSLLTIPSVVGNLLYRSYRAIMVCACVVSVLALLIGVYVSFEFDIPAGASSVIILALVFGLCRVFVWGIGLLRGK